MSTGVTSGSWRLEFLKAPQKAAGPKKLNVYEKLRLLKIFTAKVAVPVPVAPKKVKAAKLLLKKIKPNVAVPIPAVPKYVTVEELVKVIKKFEGMNKVLSEQ